MKDVKPDTVKDKETQRNVDDYLGPGKKLLQVKVNVYIYISISIGLRVNPEIQVG